MSLKSGEAGEGRAIRRGRNAKCRQIKKVITDIELGGSTCGGTQRAMLRCEMRGLGIAAIGHLHPLDARADADLDPSCIIALAHTGDSRHQALQQQRRQQPTRKGFTVSKTNQHGGEFYRKRMSICHDETAYPLSQMLKLSIPDPRRRDPRHRRSNKVSGFRRLPTATSLNTLLERQVTERQRGVKTH